MELLQFTSPAFLSSDELTMDSLAVIWLLVTASVATLALCQYTLSWHDHRILRAHREFRPPAPRPAGPNCSYGPVGQKL